MSGNTNVGVKGKVVQIIGPVIDIRFDSTESQKIHSEVRIESGDRMIVAEIMQHLGNRTVRCVSMSPTDGLRRGMTAVCTGEPIKVPVGKETLGRVMNVLGETIDDMGEIKAPEHWPIHRPAPGFPIRGL
jgi:F-type H+-transporting ATPase subunit beta